MNLEPNKKAAIIKKANEHFGFGDLLLDVNTGTDTKGVKKKKEKVKVDAVKEVNKDSVALIIK